MPVSENERNDLFNWFVEHMGRERAATVMSLLPPVGWGDVATRRDLLELDTRLSGRIDSLDARLTTRIDSLDERLTMRIDAVEERLLLQMDAKINRLRGDLLRTFGTWLFASQAAVITAVSVLFALK